MPDVGIRTLGYGVMGWVHFECVEAFCLENILFNVHGIMINVHLDNVGH